MSMSTTPISYSMEIDEEMSRLLPADSTPLSPMMRYAVMSGGKRIRPTLTLLTAQLLGLPVEAALPVGCALEMIHAYSLVHDDLPCMDDDDFRRGKPTVHKKYGEGEAVLVGDALLTLSFEILAKAKEFTAEQRLDMIQVLSEASGKGGMIGGQLLDLHAEESTLSLEETRTIHAMKTGALINAAVLLGGIAAGASKQQLETLAAFGERIGLAFQIVDDLLDCDEEDNASYVALLGKEGTQSAADQLLSEATELISSLDGDCEPLPSFASTLIHRNH